MTKIRIHGKILTGEGVQYDYEVEKIGPFPCNRKDLMNEIRNCAETPLLKKFGLANPMPWYGPASIEMWDATTKQWLWMRDGDFVQIVNELIDMGIC